MNLRKKASITNHARHIYEEFFDSCRRETNKRKQDLSQFLSTFMPSNSETILMKPPDTLKNNKERERWCKEEFREYFYEWIINNALLGHTNKYSKSLKGHRKGGKDTGERKTLRKNIRQTLITQTVEKLNNDGVKKPSNKLIAKKIPGENAGYVQKFRAKQKIRKKVAVS